MLLLPLLPLPLSDPHLLQDSGGLVGCSFKGLHYLVLLLLYQLPSCMKLGVPLSGSYLQTGSHSISISPMNSHSEVSIQGKQHSSAGRGTYCQAHRPEFGAHVVKDENQFSCCLLASVCTFTHTQTQIDNHNISHLNTDSKSLQCRAFCFRCCLSLFLVL